MEKSSLHGDGARARRRRRRSGRRTKKWFWLVSIARDIFVRAVIVEVLKNLVAETVKHFF